MRISLRVKRKTVGRADLEGPLLICPLGMQVKSRAASGLVLELAPSGAEVPDLLVGEVPLVWWHPAKQSVEVSFVKVEPPDPFTEEDVSAMWNLLLGSSLRELYSPPGQGRDHGPSRRAGRWLRPEAVPRARDACRRMLTSWPRDEDVATIWTPPDMRGGREDLVETDRRGGSRPGLPMGGALIPNRIAKRYRSSTLWTSARLATACRSLVREVEGQLASPAEGGDLLRPILQTAERAGTRDLGPPVSSWPPIAQNTLAAVIEARVSLAVGSEGHDRVPLSDVWRLYEKWLAIAVVDALCPTLGPGTEFSNGDRWGWEWVVGSAIVRVHAQATVGREPDADLAGHPDGLLSVLSDLRPDVLVTVCDPHGDQAVLCIDAKRRAKMDPSAVAEAAAKYVWGVRSGADRETPIASVIIASTAGPAEMHDEENSRVVSSFLLPTQGAEEFEELIVERVKALLAAVGPD